MTAERDGEERQTTTMITSLISRNNFGETEMTLNRQKVTGETWTPSSSYWKWVFESAESILSFDMGKRRCTAVFLW